MIELARKNAPGANFKVSSLFRAKIPCCDAVTSLGECISYLFDRNPKRNSLFQLFRNVYKALRPGGVFIFDIMESLPYELKYPKKFYSAGKDWAILFEATCDRKRRMLTRHMITFRKIDGTYRRIEEIHRVKVFQRTFVRKELERAGFDVRYLQSYGRMRLMVGRLGFLALKSN